MVEVYNFIHSIKKTLNLYLKKKKLLCYIEHKIYLGSVLEKAEHFFKANRTTDLLWNGVKINLLKEQ